MHEGAQPLSYAVALRRGCPMMGLPQQVPPMTAVTMAVGPHAAMRHLSRVDAGKRVIEDAGAKGATVPRSCLDSGCLGSEQAGKGFFSGTLCATCSCSRSSALAYGARPSSSQILRLQLGPDNR